MSMSTYARRSAARRAPSSRILRRGASSRIGLDAKRPPAFRVEAAPIERREHGDPAVSVNGITAIDWQRYTRDEVCAAGREKDGRTNDFFGFSPTLGGCARDDFVVPWRAANGSSHIRFDPAWRDSVDLNVMRCQFNRHG